MNNGPDPKKFEERNGGPDREEQQLEAALRQALRHDDPPPGFADRLMARALAGDQPSSTATPAPSGLPPAAPPVAAAQPARASATVLHWPVRNPWLRAGIAVVLLLGILEGESTYKRIREQQRRIAAATAQFQTTERVTVRALAQAKEQLQRAGVPLNFD